MACTQRWITWSLASGAFIVTLGVSWWHEGLSSDKTSQHQESAPAQIVSLTNPAQMPARPFGPSAAPLALAAVSPATAPTAAPAPEAQPPEASPEITNSAPQTEPYNTPDVDNGEMQALRDRAAAHSSRSH